MGGAVGDALGAPIEFWSYENIRHKYGSLGITDYVEYSNGSGEFTDDTQMTLFTAEGLLRAYHRAVLKGIGGATLHITYDSYQRWLFTQGYTNENHSTNKGSYDEDNGWLIKRKELFENRSPGNTCISSLKSRVLGTIGNPINNSKGCGGVMRVAPVGLIFNSNPEYSFEIASQIAAITHGHPSGYLSAGVFASMITQIISDVSLEEAIDNSLLILQKWDKHEETFNVIEKSVLLAKEYLLGRLPIQSIPEIIKKIGAGWTGEEALAIAIFCSLIYENDFVKGTLASVNHSGDSDSTGSITGNILGVINGIEQIPEKWITKLRYNDIVEEMATDLSIGCSSTSENCDENWWRKYPGV